MRISIIIDHFKDATKKIKRTMIVTLYTDIPGMEKVKAVAELPKNTPMAKEVDFIVTDMLTRKKAAITKENKKKLLAKKKKDAKKNISK